jgi:hypothetical protein
MINMRFGKPLAIKGLGGAEFAGLKVGVCILGSKSSQAGN